MSENVEHKRILLNSLPKAGTNLLSRAFDLSGIPYGELGISSALVMGTHQLWRQFARRSFFELDPLIIGLEVQMPIRKSWLDSRLAQVPTGAYVTGHANWSPGLEWLLEHHGFVTITIVRDPIDVLVSHGHYVARSKSHFLHSTYSRLDLSERVRLTLTGGRIEGLDVAPFEVMLERINDWLVRTDSAVVRFEDLVGEKGGGSPAAQENTFQLLEGVTGREFDRKQMYDSLHGGSPTFRQGRIGSSRDELTSAQLAEIEDLTSIYRQKWGYADG